MTPFFNSPERLALLRSSAESWIGTPFHPNGAAKRMGVSCQKLAGALMVESGHLPPSCEFYDGPMDWDDDIPRIEQAIDEKFAAKFQNLFGSPVVPGATSPVPGYGCPGEPNFFQPGDIIGIRIGKGVKHVGVVLDSEHFIHVMRHAKVNAPKIEDATFLPRIVRVWRPIE